MRAFVYRYGKVASLMLALMLLVVPIAQGQESAPAPASSSSKTNAEVTTFKKMSLEELMDQQVTSVAKAPERYAQAPAAIQVITGDQIHRSGASSIPEALRLADNLDVAQVSSSSWDISARGFNASVGNKLLVLMDGRSVYSPLFSGVIWNMQDYLLEDVNRIEVISGPGGTLWGANAVNGVINITSKSAADTQGLYVEGGGGSWLRDFAGARYGGTLASNVFYRVYGKFSDHGPEVYADGHSAADSWNRGQGGFRIDDIAPANDHFTLQGDLFGGDTDVTPGGEGTKGTEGTTSGGNLLGRWEHTFAEDSDLSVQLYYDRSHVAAPFQSSGTIPAGTLLENLDTYDLDFKDRFPLGTWNNVVWGFGYRFTRDLTEAAPLVAFTPGILNQSLYNGFVQDEIKLSRQVSFTLGSKVEHNDFTGFEFEPSARLQWNITDKQMVWGAVSRAVRTPSRYDRDLLEPSPAYGVFLAGNPDFETESVIAYEIGYRAQLGEKISTSISGFYNQYSDLRSLGLTAGGLPLTFQNNLKANTGGVEISGEFQAFDWWRLHGGYDFLAERVWVKEGQVDLFNALNETADPQNQIFARSSMDLPGRIELDTAVRWIDTVHNNNGGVAGSVPAYVEVDARLGWHATKNLEFSVVGQNLVHDHHAEAGFPGPNQEQIVRSVYGKVSWSF